MRMLTFSTTAPLPLLLLLLLLTMLPTAQSFVPSFQKRLTFSSSSSLHAKKKVFIDGEAGTTGLQVRDRLSGRDDLELISIEDDSLRKDLETRKKFINEADCVILCLPDAASMEAVNLVDPDNERTVVIDASTAFRVDDDWTYGFPELCPEQRQKLQTTKRISNPGCYPTGFISLIRPLVDAGLIPPGTPLTVNAISGYSGGGKGLMRVYEEEDHEPFGAYGLGLKHKHLPEMTKYSNIQTTPIFQPSVATFSQGMIVSVPIHYSLLSSTTTTGKDIHDALSNYYADSHFISVMPYGESAVRDQDLLERDAFLRPDTLKDTNQMQLFVFANDDQGHALVCARLDNLGKGASGAAVQNLNIALGLDETVGL